MRYPYPCDVFVRAIGSDGICFTEVLPPMTSLALSALTCVDMSSGSQGTWLPSRIDYGIGLACHSISSMLYQFSDLDFHRAGHGDWARPAWVYLEKVFFFAGILQLNH